MLPFSYIAKNSDGQTLRGKIEAENRSAGILLIKQKGLFLISIEQEQKWLSSIMAGAGTKGRKIGIRQRAMFTHQLGTLLKAGMRLSIALQTLARQTKEKHFAAIIEQMIRDIEDSASLSEAMARHPRVFPIVYTAIVNAAEQSGSLVESLQILSTQLKSQAGVQNRIKSAMAYPVFLIFVSLIVIAVLITFVVPKFLDLFAGANQKLPLPTQILVGMTDFLTTFWWMLPIAGIGLSATAVLLLKQQVIRFFVDNLLLELPGIGSLNKKLLLARFSRTLGSLLHGGVRILDALDITRQTTTNQAFAKTVFTVNDQMAKGTSLAKALAAQPHATDLVTSMIAVGEDSGMLPEMLLEIAEMYEQQAESSIQSMTNLLGPILIVFIGLFVGFVVMAILLPVFETSTMVG